MSSSWQLRQESIASKKPNIIKTKNTIYKTKQTLTVLKNKKLFSLV